MIFVYVLGFIILVVVFGKEYAADSIQELKDVELKHKKELLDYEKTLEDMSFEVYALQCEIEELRSKE